MKRTTATAATALAAATLVALADTGASAAAASAASLPEQPATTQVQDHNSYVDFGSYLFTQAKVTRTGDVTADLNFPCTKCSNPSTGPVNYQLDVWDETQQKSLTITDGTQTGQILHEVSPATGQTKQVTFTIEGAKAGDTIDMHWLNNGPTPGSHGRYMAANIYVSNVNAAPQTVAEDNTRG